MELIFNELSLQPTASDPHSAQLLVEKIAQTYSKAKSQGFQKIRFHEVFEQIALTEGYTFSDWLNTTSNRTLKDLLLAAKVYPFINEKDEWAETEYLKQRYFFENEFIERTEPQGLAAAIIYQTLSLSLLNHEYWQRVELPVSVSGEYLEGILIAKRVFNVCETTSFENVVIQEFIGKITSPTLIGTEIAPDQKILHLRDDHGKDKLERFGKRLLQSQYVVSVINSLPFNPKATNLIRKTYPDGKIELVLYWEDKGYGLVIQTTGRNIHETNAIAEILVEDYDD
jgi:hypothetical protein